MSAMDIGTSETGIGGRLAIGSNIAGSLSNKWTEIVISQDEIISVHKSSG